MSVAACDLCGSELDRGESTRPPPAPTFLACPSCGLVSLAVFPASSVRAEGYQDEYYDPEEGERFLGPGEALVRLFRWLRRRDLERLRVPIRAFLDIGCGRGRLVELFAHRGWQAVGTQLSQTAANAARRRGIDVRVGELGELGFADGELGLAVLYHVLEHVPAPVTTLREVHRILAPGGMVVVEVPSYAAIGFRVLGTHNLCVDYPHHLYFFTPSTLDRCVEASGFTVDQRSHFSIEYSPITTLQNLLNLLPGRPNRFLDALRKGKTAESLRREPMTWAHFAAALVLGPFALLASLAGLVAPVGNTYRVYARKR